MRSCRGKNIDTDPDKHMRSLTTDRRSYCVITLLDLEILLLAKCASLAQYKNTAHVSYTKLLLVWHLSPSLHPLNTHLLWLIEKRYYLLSNKLQSLKIPVFEWDASGAFVVLAWFTELSNGSIALSQIVVDSCCYCKLK